MYHGMEQRRWAREVAIPQAAKIAQDQPLAAFLLLRQAEQILPGDAQVVDLEKSSTQAVSRSNPILPEPKSRFRTMSNQESGSHWEQRR